MAKGSERGQMIQDIIKDGTLVPQDITISLLRDAMRENKDAPGFLIDGFPREISQGEQFEQEVSGFGYGPFYKKIFHSFVHLFGMPLAESSPAITQTTRH